MPRQNVGTAARARSLGFASAISLAGFIPSGLALAQREALPPPPTPAAPAPAPAPTEKKPDPAQPASKPAPGAAPKAPAVDAPPAPRRAEPTVGPYIERVSGTTREWTLTATVRVNSEASDSSETVSDSYGRSIQVPKKTPFDFETMSVVFPLVPVTAGSDSGVERFSGRLRMDGKIVTEEAQPMSGLMHSGVRLMRFGFNNTEKLKPREVVLEAIVRSTCSQTKFDEKAALEVGWPTGPWPDAAASTFAPQLYVDQGYDPETGKIRPYADEKKVLDAALERFLGADRIADAKASTPLRVAKAITKGVWSEIQPDDRGAVKTRRVTGEFSGVQIDAPEIVLARKKGNEHEVACLMAVLLRKAGVPARTVIGWDVSGDSDVRFLEKSSKANKLRSWIEIALYDEAKNTINWVPIDVVRARRTTSRPPPGNQPWRFFGTMNEWNQVVPFALQYHPPTDVVSYGTGSFWGWFVTPKPADAALQALSFRAERTAARGGSSEPSKGDPKGKGRDKDDEGKPKVKRGGGK